MKKKMFYFAALVAASAAFTGCSSDGALTEVLPEEIAPQNEVGVPFGVSAVLGSDDATRAAVVDASNFASFSLLAYDEDGTRWIGSDDEAQTWTKTGSGWTNGGQAPIWGKGTSNFFAFNGGTPSISQSLQTLTYTVPTDFDLQKDIVAATKSSAVTADGNISLTFTNILAGLQFAFSFNESKMVSEGMIVRGKSVDTQNNHTYAVIKSVTIHNLKNTGTYNFSTEKWTEDPTYADYKVTFDEPLKIKLDDKQHIAKTGFVAADIDAGTPAANSKLLVAIPQEVATWAATEMENATSTPKTSDDAPKAYLEVECIIVDLLDYDMTPYVDDDTDYTEIQSYIVCGDSDKSQEDDLAEIEDETDEDFVGYGTVITPLVIKQTDSKNLLQANGMYTIKVDLGYNAYTWYEQDHKYGHIIEPGGVDTGGAPRF